MKWWSYIKVISIFMALTAFTQVGGLVYLCYKPLGACINKKVKNTKRHLRVCVFLAAYVITCFMVVPPIAKKYGRVPLPLFSKKLKPATLLTCFTNRHYVEPELLDLLENVSEKVPPNMSIVYLDACFPFIDGFPLLGHLSHNDGKKVDLAFVYTNTNGKYLNSGKSLTGYGIPETPKASEVDQPSICGTKGHWQYSLTTKFTWIEQSKDYQFDLEANKLLIQTLALHGRTGKIFIEPHLKSRLDLDNCSKVRFHGCHAVRHDDHIHLQL